MNEIDVVVNFCASALVRDESLLANECHNPVVLALSSNY